MLFDQNDESTASLPGSDLITKRKNRGKVLDEIVEEVYETYGNQSDDEDSQEPLRPGMMHRRAMSEVRFSRGSNAMLTSSSGAESPLTLQAV